MPACSWTAVTVFATVVAVTSDDAVSDNAASDDVSGGAAERATVSTSTRVR